MRVRRVRHLALVEDYPQDIKERLTLKTETISGKEIVIKAYKEDTEGLWIPRAIVSRPPESTNWEKVEIAFKGKLKDYQKEVADKWLKAGGNGIIAMGTGLGKTVLALYLTHKIGLKTLVIVPGEKLFHQWIQRTKEFCGFYPTTIRGGHCDTSAPIVIATIQTLAYGKKINRKALYTKFGFVIYDEVHHLGAEKYSRVAGMFWDKHRLGLSATPKRRDGMHKLFYWHIGPPVAVYYGHQITPTVYMIRYIDWDCSTHNFRRGNDLNLPRYLNNLSSITARNILITVYAIYGYKGGRRVLVLSDRKETLTKVAHFLKKAGITDYSFLIGEEKNTDGQIILGTYGCAGEGFDLPELDYLILATPRADIRQAIGRVLRPKNKTPIVIDIVDNVSEVMRKFAKKREYTYRGLGAKIKEIVIHKEKVYALYKKILES